VFLTHISAQQMGGMLSVVVTNWSSMIPYGNKLMAFLPIYSWQVDLATTRPELGRVAITQGRGNINNLKTRFGVKLVHTNHQWSNGLHKCSKREDVARA
jgi:hypothetical protein